VIPKCIDIRFRLGDDVVDQLLGIVGSLVWILDSKTGLLASGKEVPTATVIAVIVVFVIVIVIQRAESSDAPPLLRLLGCRLGGR
jgi:hypothetical protein